MSEEDTGLSEKFIKAVTNKDHSTVYVIFHILSTKNLFNINLDDKYEIEVEKGTAYDGDWFSYLPEDMYQLKVTYRSIDGLASGVIIDLGYYVDDTIENLLNSLNKKTDYYWTGERE